MAQFKAKFIENFKTADLSGLSKGAKSLLHFYGDLNLPQRYINNININILITILHIFPIGICKARGNYEVIHGIKTYFIILERIKQEPESAKYFNSIPVFYYKNLTTKNSLIISKIDLIFMILLIPLIKSILPYFYLVMSNQNTYKELFSNIDKSQIIELISVDKHQQYEINDKYKEINSIHKFLKKLKKWV